MLSANEIQQALKSNDRRSLAEAYFKITGKPLDRNCGSCLRDARITLEARLREIEREAAPIIIYAINPTEQVLLQLEGLQVVSVDSIESAINSFQEGAVNVIAKSGIFFDDTLELAKKIKPNHAYELDAYNWNGNGHASLERGNIGAWVFRGRVKKTTDLLQVRQAGYIVLNPCDQIHAIRVNT